MTISFTNIKSIVITVLLLIKFASFSLIPSVDVLILVESLCPDCQDYIKAQVEPSLPILQDPNIVNLTIVPFGNAEIDSQSVTCQHGVGECDANSYEQCIISLIPEPSHYLPILFCVEEKLPPGRKDDTFDPPTIFSDCADEHNLDFTFIKECHDNPIISWQLQVEASKLTPSYHTGVPWVEINGEHIDEENTVLIKEICKAYLASGGSTPFCSSSEQETAIF